MRALTGKYTSDVNSLNLTQITASNSAAAFVSGVAFSNDVLVWLVEHADIAVIFEAAIGIDAFHGLVEEGTD